MTETSAATAAATAIAEPERIRLRLPRHRIERRAILLWTINSVLRMIITVGGLGVLYQLWEPSRPWLGPILWLVTAANIVVIMIMPTWRYLVHRWETTDQAAYSLQGWITREWRVAPISRIQTIDVHRGPVQQLLRLATLRVTTASQAGAITIPGLDATVAAESARQLTAITQDTPGDAT